MVATVQVQETSLSETVAIVVDGALESLRDRTTVSALDVVDLLLDLRSTLKETVELEEAATRERLRNVRPTWSEAARRAATSGLSRRPLHLFRH
jgi:hypothetical protein